LLPGRRKVMTKDPALADVRPRHALANEIYRLLRQGDFGSTPYADGANRQKCTEEIMEIIARVERETIDRCAECVKEYVFIPNAISQQSLSAEVQQLLLRYGRMG
jgi:hypothetical protein